jgi:hypothetical protein
MSCDASTARAGAGTGTDPIYPTPPRRASPGSSCRIVRAQGALLALTVA